MKKVEELLEMFVSKEKEWPTREFLHRPFYNPITDTVCASEGHMFVSVNPHKTNGKYDYHNLPVSLVGLEHIGSITVSEIESLLSQLPNKKATKETEKSITCPECAGTGEVSVSYIADYNDEEYDLECECPICCGCGCITKVEEVPTEETYRSGLIRVVTMYCQAKYIESIVKACKLLDIEKIGISNDRKGYIIVFTLDEDTLAGIKGYNTPSKKEQWIKLI